MLVGWWEEGSSCGCEVLDEVEEHPRDSRPGGSEANPLEEKRPGAEAAWEQASHTQRRGERGPDHWMLMIVNKDGKGFAEQRKRNLKGVTALFCRDQEANRV